METSEIATLLNSCEENGTTSPYVVSPSTYKTAKLGLFRASEPMRTPPVKYQTEGQEIFIISDLHLAGGRNEAGVFRGTENFFSDDSFRRFLDYANNSKRTEGAILILNGDIFDFLRVTEYPGKTRQIRIGKRIKHMLKMDPLIGPVGPNQEPTEVLENWKQNLEKVGIEKTVEELWGSISRREKKYGLGTENYKTVYKLMLVRKGHPVFFQALSQWLNDGHKLVFVKGNHDLELYWREVRNYLRLILAEGLTSWNSEKSMIDLLRTIVLPNTTFVDDSVLVDKQLYVEHGHRYDPLTTVLGAPTLKRNKAQINIPFGSFFNRYFINRVELFLPFFDNVRPTGNIIPILVKENFPLALKLIFQQIPLLFRVLFTNWRYVLFIYRRFGLFVLAILAPFIVTYICEPNTFTQLVSRIGQIGNSAGAVGAIVSLLEQVGLLIGSYLLSRLVSWFQLDEPSSLEKYAKTRHAGTKYQIMAMGHTHNPGGYLMNGRYRFYNTGTWIPVIESSTGSLRVDKTYTFLRLTREPNGKIRPARPGFLMRWNDDAGRAEPQFLIESK